MKVSVLIALVTLATLAQQSAACSERTFQRAIAAAPKTGVALKCQRAVYNELCGRCGKDISCYWNFGPKVAPNLRECHRRSLRTMRTKCSEKIFRKAIESAPKTGASLSCQRAVYNALCEECGSSVECFMKNGPSVARALPLCRPREVTQFDTAEEDIGGRDWGRICATAACLFIDNLSPPLRVTLLGQTQSHLSTGHSTRCMTPKRNMLVVAIGVEFALQQLVWLSIT